MSLRQRLQQAEPVFNFFLTNPSPWAAEWIAARNCASLTVDLQHGSIEDGDLLALAQAIRSGGGSAAVRLAWNRPDRIMKVLDLGYELLICPMIDGPEDAAAFVRAAHYAPMGSRSYGPLRASLYAEGDYFAKANDDALCFAMVETAGAIKHLEAIAATPGLDGLYLGPFDLSVSTGLEKRADFSDPNLLKMVDDVLAATRANGLFAGIFTLAPEDARAMAERGFDLVTCGTDDFVFQGAMGEWCDLLT